jgi:hypothetical protein
MLTKRACSGDSRIDRLGRCLFIGRHIMLAHVHKMKDAGDLLYHHGRINDISSDDNTADVK